MIEESDISASALLRVLGDEIAEMSRISEKIQTILVIACANLSGEPSLYKDAQACDLLTQKLSASAGFLSAIARHVPSEWSINVSQAASEIDLSELALAYSLKCPATKKDNSGVVDFF